MRIAAFLAVAAALGGCGGRATVADVSAPSARAADWRGIATSADRNRLRNWRPTWLAALAAARTADPAGVRDEAALFDPDRAMSDAMPPVGTYRCRTFKLGAKGGVTRGFIAYDWFECRVDQKGGAVRFAKTSGSQRTVGLIYPDGPSRAVFLGTLALGEEGGTLAYGRDPNRDMAGLVERIGPQRWRIAFPEPRFESHLDVVELEPVR